MQSKSILSSTLQNRFDRHRKIDLEFYKLIYRQLIKNCIHSYTYKGKDGWKNNVNILNFLRFVEYSEKYFRNVIETSEF